jgi:hypothetical protein
MGDLVAQRDIGEELRNAGYNRANRNDVEPDDGGPAGPGKCRNPLSARVVGEIFVFSGKPRNSLDWHARGAEPRHSAIERNDEVMPSRGRAYRLLSNNAAQLVRGRQFLVSRLPRSISQASYDVRNTRNQQGLVRKVSRKFCHDSRNADN